MNPALKHLLVPLVVNIVKFVVIIYTIITLPIYYLIQKPWRRLKIAQQCGSDLIDDNHFPSNQKESSTNDLIPKHLYGVDYLEYEKYIPIPIHPLMKCETLLEACYQRATLYPVDEPCLGYREIIEEEVQLDSFGKPIKIDGKILRKYKLSDYKWITFADYMEQFESTSRGLIATGLERLDPIAIYAETGLDFTVSQMGAVKSGAIIVTLYHTLTDIGIIHAINETQVKYLFVSFELLDRVIGFVNQCPSIKCIIYFEGPNQHKNLPTSGFEHIKFYTLNQIKDLGRSERYKHLSAEPLKPDELFGVLYTSGTTGIPKGVKITQSQIRAAAMATGKIIRDVITDGPKHVYIAYLPQAHVMEMTLECFLFLGGVKIGYASPFTLNESAPGLAKGQKSDLQLLKPTVMASVPLVLDRMQKEIYNKLQKRTPFSRSIFDFLIAYKSYWISKGYQTPLTNKLVCGKVQEQFGGRLEYLVVGGAPLAPNLQKQIKCALNVTLVQGYGSTETGGGMFATDFMDLSYGRVGAPMNGVRARIIDWPEGGYSIRDKPNPRGELLIGGKMISMGYLNRDELTRESFVDHNDIHWFITGDIAEIFPDGTFKIIDRKKDIVKLANGEFIQLGKIEAALKSSAFVDNICVVPNSTLNCLVALIVPNIQNLMELAKEIKQTGTLNGTGNHNHNHNYNNNNHKPEPEEIGLINQGNLYENEKIIEAVHQDIIKVGLEQSSLKPIELPSKITLSRVVWSPDIDLLTAAMKLKRANIVKHHHQDLELMWEELKKNPQKIRIKITK